MLSYILKTILEVLIVLMSAIVIHEMMHIIYLKIKKVDFEIKKVGWALRIIFDINNLSKDEKLAVASLGIWSGFAVCMFCILYNPVHIITSLLYYVGCNTDFKYIEKWSGTQ